MAIVKKNAWLLFLFLSLTAAGAFSADQRVVDCLVATVNQEIITLLDLKIFREFILTPAAQGGLSPEELLNKVIEIKLVVQAAKGEVSLSPEEVAGLRREIFQAKGEESIRERLSFFGLSEPELEAYLKEKLLYEKIIALHSSLKTSVTLREIEAYYAERYIPEEKLRGREPRPLVEVAGEVENQIRQEKLRRQLEDWKEGLRKKALIRVRNECLQFLDRSEI